MLPISVGIVNYLNTKPLLYGLVELENEGIIQLFYDFPSDLYTNFKNKKTAIALLPIASLLQLPQAKIIGNHCIAADGEVASVCLYSQVPFEEITRIYLDYQSRTSVELLKILCKAYWHISPEFIHADTKYIDNINGITAGLIIGDRALQYQNSFLYKYDLAFYWKELTGLPFVFAAWAAQINIENEFLNAFEMANQKGLYLKNEIAQKNAVDYYDLEIYYTQNIQYTLDEEKRKAIDLFLTKIKE